MADTFITGRHSGGTPEQGLVLKAGRAGNCQGPDLSVRRAEIRAFPGA